MGSGANNGDNATGYARGHFKGADGSVVTATATAGANGSATVHTHTQKKDGSSVDETRTVDQANRTVHYDRTDKNAQGTVVDSGSTDTVYPNNTTSQPQALNVQFHSHITADQLMRMSPTAGIPGAGSGDIELG